MSKFNVGDKVKYIGKNHDKFPEFYPVIGTIGVINKIHADKKYWVQWTEGTTSDSDFWCCCESDMELIIDTEMTNEEIWKMLHPKLVKNGLDWIHYGYDSEGNKFYYFDEKALINAVATAYKSGYYRSQKGRPFKIGEKKKKGGHWEPVDPNNLPKEGTKVRYSRKCGKYKDDIIKIGDTGTVVFEGIYTPLWFGMQPDKLRSGRTWFDFSEGDENCLDMWVEDDE